MYEELRSEDSIVLDADSLRLDFMGVKSAEIIKKPEHTIASEFTIILRFVGTDTMITITCDTYKLAHGHDVLVNYHE